MARVPGTMRTARLPFLVAALVATVSLASDDGELISSAQATIATFKKTDANTEKFFSSAVGYAVFPTIGKGGFVVGGAGGDGILFVGGKPVGKASMGQASVGFQLGGQTFSEIIFFENASTLSDFKHGNFALSAQASAVALSAGAAAAANYEHGVAIFTATKTGLMYEASVGGQKFGYHPFATAK
jgi:lipid-binding SYLF domain-containing protein